MVKNLFETYLTKLNERRFVVGHLIQDDHFQWSVLINRKGGHYGPGNCASAMGPTPGEALKKAYRKLWPAKRNNE